MRSVRMVIRGKYFIGVFALTGLLAVAYLVLSRRE